MKTCTRCNKELSEDNFYKTPQNKFRSWCKRCHQEVSLAYQRAHSNDNRRRGREYRDRHPFRLDVQRAHRRAVRYGVDSTLTEPEWKDKVEQCDYVCHICGIKTTLEIRKENSLSLDHKIPLNRGGSNSKENSLPACWNCNRSKGDRLNCEFLDWVKRVYEFHQGYIR